MKRSYGIDLSTIKDMHWWRFCSLFLDLSEDCFLQRIIYLRSQKAKGKLTKEERQAYYAMKDILELPQPGDAELKEIEQAFMEKLGK